MLVCSLIWHAEPPGAQSKQSDPEFLLVMDFVLCVVGYFFFFFSFK